MNETPENSTSNAFWPVLDRDPVLLASLRRRSLRYAAKFTIEIGFCLKAHRMHDLDRGFFRFSGFGPTHSTKTSTRLKELNSVSEKRNCSTDPQGRWLLSEARPATG